MNMPTAISTAIFAAVLIAAAPVASSQEKGEPRSEPKTAAPLRDMLLAQMGKRVAIRLHGDQDIEGIVTAVGAGTVQLSKLTGKDYYDAVINISKINAVIYKAR